jgi:hypothetical protein
MWTCFVFYRDVMQYDERRPFASYSRLSVLVCHLRFQKVVEGRPQMERTSLSVKLELLSRLFPSAAYQNYSTKP